MSKKEWVVVRPKTPNELRDILYELSQSPGWFFRGQDDREWALRCSIDRIFKDSNTPESFSLNKENWTLVEFKARAYWLLNEAERGLIGDKVSASTVMRHFGVPTRLLDWTLSPWVAAFFACSKQFKVELCRKAVDGAIWCFDADELVCRVNSSETRIFGGNAIVKDRRVSELVEFEKRRNRVAFSAKARPWVVPIYNRVETARMQAQQGVFTFASRHLYDHDKLIGEFIDVGNSKLARKIVIPGDFKRYLLMILKSMNIVPSTLFPGPDGIGHSLEIELNCL